jgi:hypothetical protein
VLPHGAGWLQFAAYLTNDLSGALGTVGHKLTATNGRFRERR